MEKQTIQFVRGLVLIPFFTISSPFAMLHDSKAPVQDGGKGVITLTVKERAQKIDAFFGHRNMPLEGYGAKMVAEAEKNDLDWRLLPAIAARESSGGKQACGYNPFGWGSCKIKFKDWNTAIETVAKNLGGNNPATHDYYHGTIEEKLYSYNGSVLPSYTGEVIEIMDMIEKGE